MTDLSWKKIGSNFWVEGRKIKFGAKNPWALAAGWERNENWLGVLEQIRNFYRQNPDAGV